MKNRRSISPLLLLAAVIVLPWKGCSHGYDSDELDLAFYQWNRWMDRPAESGLPGTYLPPSVGWDAFHRGVGQLVRVPSECPGADAPCWYHCRFTLPEEWADRKISLAFEGAGPNVQVYLNTALVGSFRAEETPFTLDVTKTIYYSRDNHLGIRISDRASPQTTDPDTASADRSAPGSSSGITTSMSYGITGGIRVKSTPLPETGDQSR